MSTNLRNDTFEMIPSLFLYRALKAQGMEPKAAAAAVLDLIGTALYAMLEAA